MSGGVCVCEEGEGVSVGVCEEGEGVSVGVCV